MFDFGWSELLVIAVVALLVVGPKDLPVMLRVVGRYMGMIKRQADEFRAQLSDAMQQAEFDQLRKDVTDIKAGAEESLRDVKRSFDDGLEDDPLKSKAQPNPAQDAAEEARRQRQADLIDNAFDDDFSDRRGMTAAKVAGPDKASGSVGTRVAEGGSGSVGVGGASGENRTESSQAKPQATVPEAAKSGA